MSPFGINKLPDIFFTLNMVKDVIHDKLPLQKKLQKQTKKQGCMFSVEKIIHKKLNVMFARSAKFLEIILIS